MELSKAYEPAQVQDEITAGWDREKLWHAEPDERENRYSIVIPPPNVTGALHLGHALNNTLQDILIRCHRMRGDNTVWLPGTDHAGIATQTVVDKRLQAAGEPALKEYKQMEARSEDGRGKFIEKVNAWKTEYEARILGQLKAMGCSCDWDRVAFTMDEARSKAVREAFFRLFKAGLIYRGKRLVNWDPVTLTALADDEVEMEEVDGHFYYLKYPVYELSDEATGRRSDEGNAGDSASPSSLHRFVASSLPPITVATTRPETMLGDTAVAMNPNDPRAASLRGKFIKLPIVDRIIPIIEDDYVVLPSTKITTPSGEQREPSDRASDQPSERTPTDPEDPKAKFSSGFLKVTPAHDPNDYALGVKYNLTQINVMAPDASISLDHGWSAIEPAQKDNATLRPFLSLSRELARASIVAWFKAQGLLEKVVPYRHSVGHSYRSHAAIEPYLSDQWYCKVTDERLAAAANAALATDQKSNHTSGSSDPRGTGFQPVADVMHPQSKHGLETHATDGLRFFPERYAKTYESWNTNIRDWCISRQLWWGHRIPVWTSGTIDTWPRWRPDSSEPRYAQEDCVPDDIATQTSGSMAYVCVRDPEGDDRGLVVRLEQQGFRRDPDVLDTWFSSALWPLSTLGWPGELATAETATGGLTDHSFTKANKFAATTVDYWNPTSVLATGRDIITLWVSRMVMFNIFLKSDEATKRHSDEGNEGNLASPSSLRRSVAPSLLPFRHVYINPTIQDGQGQRMSKSLGNGVDPLDVIHTHGADAMRFTLASMATTTQDARLSVDLIDPHTGETFEPTFITTSSGYSVAAPIQEYKGKKCVSSYGAASGAAAPSDAMPLAKNTSAKFDLGRNFCNKLWNAARFVLMQIDQSGTGFQPVSDAMRPHATHGMETHATEEYWSTIDRWILSRLARTIQACNVAIDSYRFDLYQKACYDFIWRDYCDWYLEAAKPAMRDPLRRESTARILATCLDVALRLMHPLIPFVTEKLWGALRDSGAARGIDDRFPCNVAHAATKSVMNSTQIMVAPFPTFTDRTDTLTSEGAERVVGRLQEIVAAIRQLRNDNRVDSKKRVAVSVQCAADVEHHLSANREFLESLAVCTLEAIGPATAEPANSAKSIVAGVTLFVAGVVDAGAADKRRAELAKSITGMRGKLSNEGYVAKAPPKVVEETRAMLAAAEAELAKLG